MYTQILRECECILATNGITSPKFTIYPSQHLLSHTHCSGTIYIGKAVRLKQRLFGGGVMHSMLHEIVHTLIAYYPPAYEALEVFGSPMEWDRKQCFVRTLKPRNVTKYISQYAQTHPEEDMVETAVHVLLGTYRPSLKSARIKEWFKEIAGVC